MTTLDHKAKLLLNLAKTQTILNNRLDRGLGGLSFSEFLILYHLSQAQDQQMRRVDIAEKVGLTASGITRLLLPMEKVHLVTSGPIETDARVRLVRLAPGGQEKLTDALERLQFFAEEIMPTATAKDIQLVSDLVMAMGGRATMV